VKILKTPWALTNSIVMSPAPPLTDDEALANIEKAYKNFQRVITPDDARAFHSGTLRDVRDAALDIQKRLAAKQSSRNMRRIKPLLDSIDHYSKFMDVLCNGVDYLPCVWVCLELLNV
jgi:tRNA nucleotidyltransferase (CCA-adding enzyme)